MPKKKQCLLNSKRKRSIEEDKEIELTIKGKNENFDLISYKLDKANELFNEYKIIKKKEMKWENIKKVIDLVEINPTYNYEFLKCHIDFEQENYDYDFNQLSPTLSEEDYFSLTKKEQKNPSIELFELLKLFVIDKKKFEEETKQIAINKYNIPLIEGNEKIRINYYLQLFAHFTLFMNDNQKKYLLNPKNKITNNDRENMEILKNKYNNIKNGINFFEKLIPKMDKFFNDINLEENDFNKKIFTFILYITDIIYKIPFSGIESKIIFNFFQKEVEPKKELLEYTSLENIIKEEESTRFPNNFGIKKKYLNDTIRKNDKYKDKKMNEFIIYNNFESIEFDGRNYIIQNLIDDYISNAYIPLEILLLRNQSLSFFEQNKNNFLNVNNNIFKEFKEYFKFFIKTKCVEMALEKDSNYINIEKIIKDDSIINKFLSDKNLRSIPLFEFAASDYTNKDILISFISGFPFKIHRYNIPKNKKEYKILKGIIILFNVGMKMITTVHELIIHLCFGYLNYISEGKISYKSPKKIGKIKREDGGLVFEEILFGRQYGDITLNDILVILNGEHLNSLKNFKKHLGQEFNSKKFIVKSNLLKSIFKKYKITVDDLKNNNKVYSTMKSSESGMFIRREVMNILLPYKAPIPYSNHKE
jgi:hypothetical protein